MTKKIFAMFLAVLMVVSMLPTSVFAAGNGCPIAKDDHTIENCEWTVVKVTEPSCGKEGYTSYKCNTCGDLFVDSMVPATGEHVWKEVPQQDPTCEKDGLTAGYQCEICGANKGRETIDKLYEDRKCEWTAWTPAKLDCTVGGTKTRECKHCGAVEELKVEKVDAHIWGEPVLKTPATADATGVAVAACTNPNCDVTKEIKVFFAHDCVLGIVPAVEPNCATGTNGTYAHYECRVCGELFDLNGDKITADKLVWKAEHNFGAYVPTCLDTFAYCYNECCKKNVAVSVAHDVNVTTYKPATCTSAGYKIGECSVCAYVVYEAIEALGHIGYTTNVPSTCGTYAYTFTVCLRGCPGQTFDNNTYVDTHGIWYDVSVESFFLELDHKKVGSVLYFDGTVSNKYYLGVTDDKANAVKIYTEEVAGVEGAIRLFFINAKNEKTYIDIVKTETGYVNAVMSATPVNYFTWNATKNTWTVAIDDAEYYLGARSDKSYKNIDAMMVNEYDNFKATLIDSGDVSLSNVVSINVDYKSGFDANNHKLITIRTEPTCQSVGSIYSYCYNHSCPVNYTEYKVLEKVDHKWTAATQAEVEAAGLKWMAPLAATCTEKGYAYEKCVYEGCGKVELHTEAAKGHNYDPTKATDGTFDGDHKTDGYDYWTCQDCAAHIPTNFKTWWGLNHTWDTLAEAEAAHGCTLIDLGSYTVKGDCANLGLRKYRCSDPNCDAKVIYVKVQDEFGYTGGHTYDVLVCSDPNCTEPNCDGTKDPTCTEKGYFVTYQCTRCKAIVGNAALGHHNEIAAKGHDMVANSKYKVSACDKPNFGAYSHYCKNCDYKVYPTYKLGESATSATCTTQDYLHYMCACGEEHIINFVGKFGHEMVMVDGTYVDSTCRETGSYLTECLHCGYTKSETVAKKAHVNKAGEKFTDHCNDTVTDRHCVDCHKFYNHDALGNSHDCYAKDKDGNYICLDKCLIGKYCNYYINEWRESTCTTNAHTIKVCEYCGDEKVDFAPSDWWNGHKPVAADADLYANYVYEMYTWKYVVVVETEVDGITVKSFDDREETYLAKFLEYKAPTYTEAGYYKAFCTECQQVVEQVLPKKEGLGFELKVENANGAKEFTFGSLIEVTVSANSAMTAVYGFDFDMEMFNDTVFVGYETLNDNFILTVTDPEKVVDNIISITGYAANDASGKMQNVDINADTQLVKLYFRCMEGALVNGKATFEIVQDTAMAWTAVNGKMVELAECNFAKAQVPVRAYLNFNNDSQFHVTDLYLAMSLLTGEHADGKTYDVTMDINKDGEFTLEELSIAYNYWVGNYELYDLLVMGVDEAELPLLKLDQVTTCNNSACQKEIAADATYCPYCGNHQ